MTTAPRSERPGESGTAVEPATSVRVRYFAGARAATGVAEETVRVSGSGSTGTTVADVVDAVLTLHDERLARITPACSFLVNGVAVRDRTSTVPDAAEFDVLPPFAGG